MTPLLPRPDACLLDLDGVLVRTEELHHEAYRRMCAERGQALGWSFERYCLAAHYGRDRLRDELARELPALFAREPRWEVLYAEKSAIYLDLLGAGGAELMPGADELLRRLAERGAPRAIVTNSTAEQAALLRRHLPLLESIPEWVTRQDYRSAKPAPDAYVEAVRRLGVPAGRCLGLEDTPRGVEALSRAGVRAVLVTAIPYRDLGGVEPALRIRDLTELPAAWLP